jgi:urease accessory protein
MSAAQLLSLLHLCDSLFPTGGFSHSDGLEAAAAAGLVGRAGDLRLWMEACLDETLARFEGPAVLRAWQAFGEQQWTDLRQLDEEVHALRPSATARQASRAMGLRLLKTWRQIYPHPDLDALLSGGVDGSIGTLPVAFGAVCASAWVEPRAAVAGFIYTRLAAAASCAMRLMPIGQNEAHALLAAFLARVPEIVESIVRRNDPPEAFAPASDLALMSQQYVRSRLFRS